MEPGKIAVKALCVITRNGTEVLAGLGHDDVKGHDIARVMGGTVEFGETSLMALRREFHEELATDLVDIELVEVIENLFVYKGEKGHEITFVYKGRLVDESLYEREDLFVLDAPHVKEAWVPLSDVDAGKIHLYPEIDYRKLIG